MIAAFHGSGAVGNICAVDFPDRAGGFPEGMGKTANSAYTHAGATGISGKIRLRVASNAKASSLESRSCESGMGVSPRRQTTTRYDRNRLSPNIADLRLWVRLRQSSDPM